MAGRGYGSREIRICKLCNTAQVIDFELMLCMLCKELARKRKRKVREQRRCTACNRIMRMRRDRLVDGSIVGKIIGEGRTLCRACEPVTQKLALARAKRQLKRDEARARILGIQSPTAKALAEKDKKSALKLILGDFYKEGI